MKYLEMYMCSHIWEHGGKPKGGIIYAKQISPNGTFWHCKQEHLLTLLTVWIFHFQSALGKKKHDIINMKVATQTSKYSLGMKPRVTFVFAYLEKYLKTLIVLLFLGKKRDK